MPYASINFKHRRSPVRAVGVRAAFSLLLVALTIGGAGRARAQQAVSSATLGGRVADAQGAAVGGASVVVTNAGTNQRLTATTDEEGRFRFSYVPVGDYRLAVAREGFAPFAGRLTLAVGQAADLTVTLAVGRLTESVEVVAGARLADAARTQASENVLPREVDALPINGRNGDTNFNDRPAGVGRNTGRGFDHASLDLRLSRRFALAERAGIELVVEGFNVLNRANLQLPNNVYGAGAMPLATFGRATAAADPRQIQLGLRLDF